MPDDKPLQGFQQNMKRTWPKASMLMAIVLAGAAALSWVVGVGDNLEKVAQWLGIGIKPFEVTNAQIFRIFFEYDRSGIQPDHIKTLQNVIGLMIVEPNFGAIITGYSDEEQLSDDGKPAPDRTLIAAKQRAESVVKYLTNAGVPRERLYVRPPRRGSTLHEPQARQVTIEIGTEKF